MTRAGVALVLLVAAGSMARVEGAPPAISAAKVCEGNAAFALDLYARLAEKPGNVFFSPFSVSTALAMTSAGARGETARQMAATLRLTGVDAAAGFRQLLAQMAEAGPGRGCRLIVANRLWGQKGAAFRPEFLRLIEESYGGGLETVDFAGAREEARSTINDWVEKKTEGKIKDLVARGVLTPATRLVLANAIYFKGVWEVPFDRKATLDAPFTVSPEKKVVVPMMGRGNAGLTYLAGDGFQAVSIPYYDFKVRIVVFLPDKLDGLGALEKSLSVANLNAWLKGLKPEKVDAVQLPRFRVTRECDLRETLATMGMPLAFSVAADFSGIDGGRNLFIANVLHKACVDVNEEGTEAAAATAVHVVPGVLLGHRRPIIFRADHPFLFLIRDWETGSVLFMGRVVDPSEGAAAPPAPPIPPPDKAVGGG